MNFGKKRALPADFPPQTEQNKKFLFAKSNKQVVKTGAKLNVARNAVRGVSANPRGNPHAKGIDVGVKHRVPFVRRPIVSKSAKPKAKPIVLSYEDRAFITSMKALNVQVERKEKLLVQLSNLNLSPEARLDEAKVEEELKHCEELQQMAEEDGHARKFQAEEVEKGVVNSMDAETQKVLKQIEDEDQTLAATEKQISQEEQQLIEEVFTLDAQHVKKSAVVEPKAMHDWTRFDSIIIKEVTCQILLNRTFYCLLNDHAEAELQQIKSDMVPTDSLKKSKLANCIESYLAKMSQLYLQRSDRLPRTLTVVLLNPTDVSQTCVIDQIGRFLKEELGYKEREESRGQQKFTYKKYGGTIVIMEASLQSDQGPIRDQLVDAIHNDSSPHNDNSRQSIGPKKCKTIVAIFSDEKFTKEQSQELQRLHLNTVNSRNLFLQTQNQ